MFVMSLMYWYSINLITAILYMVFLSALPTDEDESQIDPADPHLLTAASLLGVDGGQLRQWLGNRRIVTAQETLTTPLTPAQVSPEAIVVYCCCS